MLIKKPIDLQEIKEKIDNERVCHKFLNIVCYIVCLQYVSVERFMVDINTLFKNAKFFNEETSTIYEVRGVAVACDQLCPLSMQHADLLYKVAKASFQQLTNPAGSLQQPVETSATPSPAPHMSVPATAKRDIPIDPKVGALFDEIKMFIVSDIISVEPLNRTPDNQHIVCGPFAIIMHTCIYTTSHGPGLLR